MQFLLDLGKSTSNILQYLLQWIWKEDICNDNMQ